MKTNIHPNYQMTTEGQVAEDILRSCVHCGFCTATCPTYQVLSDERDSPRGRIYLIKQLLETDQVTEKTQTHLDRCLTCRSCETTCPSGVEYGKLVDIGRSIVERKVPRSPLDKITRRLLRRVIPNPTLFGFFLFWGQLFKPLLPSSLAAKVPEKQVPGEWPQRAHFRKAIILQGCAQSVATPQTNIAAARVCDRLGIQLMKITGEGCCGAVSYHLSAHDEGKAQMRKNIDRWWPAIEAGVEALIVSASGCGAMVKEYGDVLADDPLYAERARKISGLTVDLAEFIGRQDISGLQLKRPVNERVAVHCPCTLQHAQQLPRVVHDILEQFEIPLADTRDDHLCCGSAGTYSVLQRELSGELLDNKIDALTGDSPDVVVTANIGCQLHLGTKSPVPVRHWIEWLDEHLVS